MTVVMGLVREGVGVVGPWSGGPALTVVTLRFTPGKMATESGSEAVPIRPLRSREQRWREWCSSHGIIARAISRLLTGAAHIFAQVSVRMYRD